MNEIPNEIHDVANRSVDYGSTFIREFDYHQYRRISDPGFPVGASGARVGPARRPDLFGASTVLGLRNPFRPEGNGRVFGRSQPGRLTAHESTVHISLPGKL